MQIINGLYKIYTKIINKLRLFIYNSLKIEEKINEQKKIIDELTESIKNINKSIKNLEESFVKNHV